MLGEIYGVNGAPVKNIKRHQPATRWIHIFTDDPQEQGIEKFAELLQVKAALEQLQPIGP